LAAYCYTVHQITGARAVLVNAMTANRQYPRTRDLVVSMNQWAKLASHWYPGQPFDEYALDLHDESLHAYQYGCYDVDMEQRTRREVLDAVGPIGCEVYFNYVQGETGAVAETADLPSGWTILRRPRVFHGGPGIYLVATQGGQLELAARTRWSGVDDDAFDDLLSAVHDLLLPS
jgi:hypothetical protein